MKTSTTAPREFKVEWEAARAGPTRYRGRKRFASALALFDFVMGFLAECPAELRPLGGACCWEARVRVARRAVGSVGYAFRPADDPEHIDELCGKLWEMADGPGREPFPAPDPEAAPF